MREVMAAGADDGLAMDVRPLLATADQQLIDHVRSLADAGGLEIVVAGTVPEVHAHWQLHEQVLVGDDLCASLAALPRRREVSVLVWQPLRNVDAPSEVWKSALALGAEQVVELPEADHWLAELLTRSDLAGQGTGRLLAITGACGGAGASSLALGLASALTKAHQRVLLIDGDFAGGGLDLLLGAESQAGTRWSELAELSGRVSNASLMPSLPQSQGIRFVSCSRSTWLEPADEAWSSLLHFGQCNFDVVLIDLPRELASSAGAWWPAGTARELWCVVPTRIRPIAAAAVSLQRWEQHWSSVACIAHLADGGVGAGDLGRALGRPVLGSIPHESAVVTAGELGEACGGSYAKACAQLARQLLTP